MGGLTAYSQRQKEASINFVIDTRFYTILSNGFSSISLIGWIFSFSPATPTFQLFTLRFPFCFFFRIVFFLFLIPFSSFVLFPFFLRTTCTVTVEMLSRLLNRDIVFCTTLPFPMYLTTMFSSAIHSFVHPMNNCELPSVLPFTPLLIEEGAFLLTAY